MQITIISRVRRPGITSRRLRAIVQHALEQEECAPQTEVCVVLVDNPTIRRLNRRYKGITRATDVLAFPANVPVGPGTVLGDVVVAVDRAKTQAKAIGHALRTEVALLAVHGVLHLLGYSDQTAAKAKVMGCRQRELVAQCGEEVRG